MVGLAGTGCSSVHSNIPLGTEAFTSVPAAQAAPDTGSYEIGPLDTVNVTVFREPQLSAANLQVDSGGEIVLPLIGKVQAVGMSAAELSTTIEASLKRYLTRPSVEVSVNSAHQTVAVEGAVNQPGVYPIPGKTTLVGALALARSTNEVAAADQVVVFRQINGQTAGARFDINRIRAGLDPDPAILPGDRVVVGMDGMKDAWRNFFSNGLFNVFRVGVAF